MQKDSYRVSTHTPWGRADNAICHARGIIQYFTPSHGGYHLSKARNALVPEHMRKADGWYEEDCEWCKVVMTFPEYFAEVERIEAHKCYDRWFKDEAA